MPKPIRTLAVLSFLLAFSIFTLSAQQPSDQGFNLDFEEIVEPNSLPTGWREWGTGAFTSSLDPSAPQSGDQCVLVEAAKEDFDKNDFGGVGYTLPAPTEGKKVKLSGYLKMEEVKGGFAGLVMRVDGPGGSLAFDNMHKRELNGSSDWTAYEIELKLPSAAERIVVGGILTGSGKAWFDNFELTVDGKPIEEALANSKPAYKAELDDEFDSGTDIRMQGITVLQLESLVKLGRIWGYVKYRHPAIAAGEYNWDYELFRVLPEVLAAEEAEEVNRIILNWLPKVKGKAKGGVKENEKAKLRPDIDWTEDEAIFGEKLSAYLQRLQGKRPFKRHYYISLNPNVGNPKFLHEAAYKDMDPADVGFKLLALFRYHAMVEYFFPNRHLMDEPWEQQLRSFIPRMVAADDARSYKLALLELIGKIQDTHASIWGQDPTLTDFWGEYAVPVDLKYVEEKMVVTRVFEEADDADIQVGDVILAVGGIPTAQLIDDISPFCPASNRPTQMRNVARKLLRSSRQEMELHVERNGKRVHVKTPCVEYMKVAYWEQDSPAFRIIDGKYGCLFPGSLKKGDIDGILKQLPETEGLVIDFRCYPSDFIVFNLGAFLVPEKTDFVQFTTGNIRQPGEFEYSQSLAIGKKNPDAYGKPVVILVDETTQSSAEYHCMAFRAAPKATVLGSTTAGADGNVSEIYLPGAVRTMISGIGILYPDGGETQRVGIVPDEEMRPTVAGIRAGRDELMERAVEILQGE